MVENDYIKFWKEQGILYSSLKKTMDFGLQEASEIIKLRHAISNNEHQFWCMDNRNIRSVSKEAHDYISEYGQDFVVACAVIADSVLTRFIVDVFIKIKKPYVPMKIFTTKENAVDWLMEMKNKKNISDNVEA